MTEQNTSSVEVKKSILPTILAWVVALAICAGLVSFLIWQPLIARAMSERKGLGVNSDYQAPSNLNEDALENMPAFEVTPEDPAMTRELEIFTAAQEYRPTAIEYTVVEGDVLDRISEQFGVNTETILFANRQLQDKADMVLTGAVLTIPPVDGIWYRWRSSDTLQKVAERYNAFVRDIIYFIGNNLDVANPTPTPGSYIMIPGGWRELVDLTGPATVVDANGTVRSGFEGPGACAISGFGLSGNGFLIWPSAVRFISGNRFGPGHNAIDIGAGVGSQLFAADNGTVVYAGWLNGGYGNLVVIDHNNGWVTMYEHLDRLGVACGDSVNQGAQIGTAGTTGNSTGGHLHFEVRIGGTPVNPLDYLP